MIIRLSRVLLHHQSMLIGILYCYSPQSRVTASSVNAYWYFILLFASVACYCIISQCLLVFYIIIRLSRVLLHHQSMLIGILYYYSPQSRVTASSVNAYWYFILLFASVA